VNLRSAGLIVAAAITIALVTARPGARTAAAASTCDTAPPGNVASALLAIVSSTPHPTSVAIDYDAEVARFTADLKCAQEVNDLDQEFGNLGSLGVIETEVGHYTEALDDEEQALAIAQRMRNLDTQGYENLAMGDTESALGLFQDAIGHYRTAIDFFEKETPQPDIGPAALAYSGMGVATERETEEGEKGASYAAALALVDQAEQMFGHPSAQTLAARGSIESQLGNYPQALEAYDELLAYARQSLDDSLQASALTDIAAVEVQETKYADAATHAHAAVAIDKALGVPQWQGLAAAANAESKLPNGETQALADYDAAIADIERLRANISENEGANARSSFFRSTLYVYDSYIDYLLELDRLEPNKGHDKKALEIFERREGRAFLEQVSRSSASTFAGADPKLVNQENALNANVLLLNDQLSKAAPGPAADARRSSRDAAEAKLTTFEEKALREQAPAYYRLLHPQTLRLADYQQHVLRANEAVLVYDVLPDQTALWVITPHAMRLFVLPASGSDALAARLTAASAANCHAEARPGIADSLNLSPYAVRGLARADFAECASAGAALYSYLIPAGAAAMLAQATTLYIVPTGPLYGSPFETLVTATGTTPRYLIEDKAVAYLSSASLLEVLRSGVEQRQAIASHPLVAFADPNFTESGKPETAVAQLQLSLLFRSAPGNGGAFPALPGSKREADAAFAALGVTPSASTLYDGDRATLQAIESLNASKGLRAYHYLLFGTHAVLPYQRTGLSEPAIVLAHPETNDDYLKMGQVFGLYLDADAVVLSACESGSVQSAGDSVEGLTQAFMYAGTPIVAVTDWQVVDTIQEQLTPQFFSAMAHGKSAAQALQQAKLTLIHSSDPLESHPYFWAPMVIFGDGDAH
jgi:CHAT domain-containing protein